MWSERRDGKLFNVKSLAEFRELDATVRLCGGVWKGGPREIVASIRLCNTRGRVE